MLLTVWIFFSISAEQNHMNFVHFLLQNDVLSLFSMTNKIKNCFTETQSFRLIPIVVISGFDPYTLQKAVFCRTLKVLFCIFTYDEHSIEFLFNNKTNEYYKHY